MTTQDEYKRNRWQLLGYVIFTVIVLVTALLYGYDQERRRTDRCLDGRRDIRDSLIETVRYAFEFDPEGNVDEERFLEGLEVRLEKILSDSGCY